MDPKSILEKTKRRLKNVDLNEPKILDSPILTNSLGGGKSSFLPRHSILDRESLHPMRGFLALFWITLFIYAAVSAYRNYSIFFMGVNLELWRRAYCDFEAFFIMVATIYLYSYVALGYQWVVAYTNIGMVRKKWKRLMIRQCLQSGPIIMAVFVAKYRDWPGLQKGSLLIFSLVMNMKMHSFLSVNEAFHFHSITFDPVTQDPLKSNKNDYPKNLTINDFTRFLWFPALIYSLQYPRTERIRWPYLVERTFGIIAIFVIFYVVLGHYVHPILKKIDKLSFIDAVVDLLLPCLASALLIFFLIFEYILNWAAEITRFADRQFYSDWWNSLDMYEFSTKWNIPVHRFLQHHIYSDCLSHNLGKFKAQFLTFLYSAVFHELVLSFTISEVRFWILGMQMLQLPLMYGTRALNLRKFPFLANCIWWLMMILGLPVLVVLYARSDNLKSFRRILSPK